MECTKCKSRCSEGNLGKAKYNSVGCEKTCKAGFICTRERGHTGEHEALDYDGIVYARWPAAKKRLRVLKHKAQE